MERGYLIYINIIITLEMDYMMDYMQQPDSGSLFQAVGFIENGICRKTQQELNQNNEIEWLMPPPERKIPQELDQNNEVQILMPPPERLLPLVAPHSPLLGVQLYVPQTQSQSHEQSEPSQLDFEQYQHMEEDLSEEIVNPPNPPRIRRSALRNRPAEDGPNRRRNYMKYILRWTSRSFLTDPIVVANELPRLRNLGIRRRSIKRKLLLLEKRPSVTITDMYYLILNPRITDSFKNAFARYFEYYLEYYLQIEARKSLKLKDIEPFIKYHRRITEYLSRLETQTVANLNI